MFTKKTGAKRKQKIQHVREQGCVRTACYCSTFHFSATAIVPNHQQYARQPQVEQSPAVVQVQWLHPDTLVGDSNRVRISVYSSNPDIREKKTVRAVQSPYCIYACMYEPRLLEDKGHEN